MCGDKRVFFVIKKFLFVSNHRYQFVVGEISERAFFRSTVIEDIFFIKVRIFFDCEYFFFVILELGQNVKAMNTNQVAVFLKAWVSEKFIPRDDIVNNLTTNDPAKPVSAAQAKTLQDNKLDKTANAVSATKLKTS